MSERPLDRTWLRLIATMLVVLLIEAVPVALVWWSL